jgi:hypothetical protein
VKVGRWLLEGQGIVGELAKAGAPGFDGSRRMTGGMHFQPTTVGRDGGPTMMLLLSQNDGYIMCERRGFRS